MIYIYRYKPFYGILFANQDNIFYVLVFAPYLTVFGDYSDTLLGEVKQYW